MHPARTRVMTIAIFAGGVAAFVTGPAWAADIQWNGGFSQFWHNEFNWDPFGSPFSIRRIPGDIDTANLLAPAGDDVFLGGNTDPINGIIVSNGIELHTNSFFLNVDNGGTAVTTVAGGARLHLAPRPGGRPALETDALFLTGDAALLLHDGEGIVQGNTTMFSGSSVTSPAAGEIHFGGDVTMLDSVIRLFGGATAAFPIGGGLSAENGSIVDLAQQVDIQGGMVFEFKSGSRFKAESLNIGRSRSGAGSTGTLVLDSEGVANTRVDVTQDLTIGHATTGSGLFEVRSSNATAQGLTRVNATGTMELIDSTFAAWGGLLIDGGTMTAVEQGNPVFLDANGTLTARNGGLIDIDGSQAFRAGQIVQFKSGADLRVTDSLTLGTGSFGTATIEFDGVGTTVEVGSELILGEDDDDGYVTLRGEATGTTGEVTVGHSGTGLLTIESGSTLQSTTSRIGQFSSASGMVTVSGSGSTWENSGFLAVGSSGVGQLRVENGGRVTSTHAYLGSDSSATGTATVTGAGSDWTMSGRLSLGGGSLGDLGGSGTLNVLADGSVHVASEIVVYSQGQLRLAGGTLTTPRFDLRGGEFEFLSGTLHVNFYPGDLLNQGGVLAPGESPGATTILGNYTQLSGGVLEIEVAGNLAVSEYDQVSMTGFAALDGELQLVLLDEFLPAPDETFTVLSALGGIAGVFNNVTTGQRLDTVDGSGSFLVHYGPGSVFDESQIVLAEFLAMLHADFDANGTVDGNDFLIWQANFGITSGANPSDGDATGDGDVDGEDFLTWQQEFRSGSGSGEHRPGVPEPATRTMFLVALAASAAAKRPLGSFWGIG